MAKTLYWYERKSEKKKKNDFEYLLSWWIMQFLEKTIENVRKRIYIKLVTTERRKNYLVSEPNYHTTKFFTQHLLAIEMKKAQIHMTRAVYLGLLTLELSTILMYEF